MDLAADLHGADFVRVLVALSVVSLSPAGLTTATSIWATAALGMAVGSG